MCQKLNPHSSTEVEQVAVDNCLHQVLWTHLFLIFQGYSTGETIIHQDNKSVMLLSQNGNQSSSQQTRHLNVRYYFVMFTGVYWECRNWYGNAGNLPRQV